MPKNRKRGARRSANKAPKAQRRPSQPLRWLSAPPLHPLNARRDGMGLALFTAAVFVLYAASTARTVMLEDDGLFITTAYYAGVAHPPGYPLFTALGWLFTQLPFGSVAWRVHCLSGLMGAITCGAIAWLVLRRTGNRPAAYLAGAALAVSGHYWSQAIISDVYTLNTALLFGALVLAQEAAAAGDTKRGGRLWLFAALLIGSGLANHWPLFVLGGPLLIAPAFASGRNFWRRIPVLAPAALGMAAASYCFLLWRSQMPEIPINFLGPLESWNALQNFAGRSIYAGADTSVNAGIMDKVLYARDFLVEAFWVQFTVAGGALAVFGAYMCYRAGRRLVVAGEMLAFLCSSFLLIFMLGFDYEYFRVAIFRPYPLVAYCVMALWLGYGGHFVWRRLNARAADWKGVRPQTAAWAMGACFALGIFVLGLWNGIGPQRLQKIAALDFTDLGPWDGWRNENFRPEYDFAEVHAKLLFDLVEPNSVLVTYGDSHVLPIAYLHLVQGMRPDLQIMEAHGLVFTKQPFRAMSTKEDKEAAWNNFGRHSERPVYYSAAAPIFTQLGWQNTGYLKKVDPTIRVGDIVIGPQQRMKEFYRYIASRPAPQDSWITFRRNLLMENYGRYLGLAQYVQDPELNEHIRDILPLARQNYWSLIGMSKVFLEQARGANALYYSQLAEEHVSEAIRVADDDRTKAHVATELYLQGRAALNLGDRARALALLRESAELDKRDEKNLAHHVLKQISLGNM